MKEIDFEKLAKTELHCHLDGSIPFGTIKKLLKLAKIEIPDDDDDLKQLIKAPKSATSLMDYLKTFDFIRPLLQSKEALQLASYDLAKSAAQEGVIYMEIRFAPELSMDQGLTLEEIMEAVLKGANNATRDFGIVTKIIVCGMRQSSLTLTEEIFKKVIRWAEKGLVGFDFAGNELDFPPEYLSTIIEETQKLGLPFTLHAGECGCANYISQAIDLGIKRLGHVTAVSKNPDLLRRLRQEGVTAELCLTSNLQTKAAPTIADFPYLMMKQAGVKLSINTDNRTVSDTNLTKEYQLYNYYFGTSVADFYRHNCEAIEASFASPSEKKELLERLKFSYQYYL